MPIREINTNEYLLAELQNGQEWAFDFIFRKYYKALTAQAVATVKDLDLAQGLVQECFIKLWENRAGTAGIQNLTGYLSFMVRNRCIDHLRKQKAKENLHNKLTLKVEDNGTEEFIASFDFEEKLVRVLTAMPERTRMAFEYSRFENLTYKEIAEKMGISVKAVEANVSRALKILRTEMKDYLPLLLLVLE